MGIEEEWLEAVMIVIEFSGERITEEGGGGKMRKKELRREKLLPILPHP